ncbi:unnamed protein product [Linum tenue]|uniref:Uncharacterized protein n=1 Tax=Linum tenue TaxID=586396 RepID=A0AAV0QQA7_9ROSI|nr:unnamed protein product [Linum tenue]
MFSSHVLQDVVYFIFVQSHIHATWVHKWVASELFCSFLEAHCILYFTNGTCSVTGKQETHIGNAGSYVCLEETGILQVCNLQDLEPCKVKLYTEIARF